MCVLSWVAAAAKERQQRNSYYKNWLFTLLALYMLYFYMRGKWDEVVDVDVILYDFFFTFYNNRAQAAIETSSYVFMGERYI